MMKRKKGKRRYRSKTRLQVQESLSEVNVIREIDTIVESAQMGIFRIIAINPFVFFSTESGDAWMLDPADELAMQLARVGDPLPYLIHESANQAAIVWTSNYRIGRGLFEIIDRNTGGIRTIYGYPTVEIAEIIARMEIS